MANEQKTNEERVNDPTVNVIVSNPPYICEREKKDMRPNVLEYEPSTALFVPDDDPLMFYRRISSLRLGRHLFFEINESFAPEMKELLEKEGYTDIRITKDIYGKARVIECRMAE
jgi:release factor glutamine methyltransferase